MAASSEPVFTNTSDSSTELTNYLAQPCLAMDSDPLQYWKNQYANFVNYGLQVPYYPCIISTSWAYLQYSWKDLQTGTLPPKWPDIWATDDDQV
jgi:hypothetical protein